MASNTIKQIIKVTEEQLKQLQNGQTVKGFTLQDDVIYLVKDSGNLGSIPDPLQVHEIQANIFSAKDGDLYLTADNYAQFSADWTEVKANQGLTLKAVDSFKLECAKFGSTNSAGENYEYYFTISTEYDAGTASIWAKKWLRLESDYGADIVTGTNLTLSAYQTSINLIGESQRININAFNYIDLNTSVLGTSANRLYLNSPTPNIINTASDLTIDTTAYKHNLKLLGDSITIQSVQAGEGAGADLILDSARHLQQTAQQITLKSTADIEMRSSGDTVISSGGTTKLYGDVVLLSKNTGGDTWAVGRYYYNDAGTLHEVYSPLNPQPAEKATTTALGQVYLSSGAGYSGTNRTSLGDTAAFKYNYYGSSNYALNNFIGVGRYLTYLSGSITTYNYPKDATTPERYSLDVMSYGTSTATSFRVLQELTRLSDGKKWTRQCIGAYTTAANWTDWTDATPVRITGITITKVS